MTDKAKRLRGSNSHGRGYGKHKAGARGGTGNAGLWDHKVITDIHNKNRPKKVTCIRDIESKLDRFIRKGFIKCKYIQSETGLSKEYKFTYKFAAVYGKILSQGEPTGKYMPHRDVKFSKTTKLKSL